MKHECALSSIIVCDVLTRNVSSVKSAMQIVQNHGLARVFRTDRLRRRALNVRSEVLFTMKSS